jgi:hypothetical protein
MKAGSLYRIEIDPIADALFPAEAYYTLNTVPGESAEELLSRE